MSVHADVSVSNMSPPDEQVDAAIEIVPAILRSTFEGIESDWNIVRDAAKHIQVDITDGIFAGDGTFRDVKRFKQLNKSEKIELHMMVHTPANFVADVIDLSPARCVFHLEAFAGSGDLHFVYQKLGSTTQTELALAINPESPSERLYEYMSLIDYVLFMGYNPGWANQDINPHVYRKIGAFKDKYPRVPVEVDGHVSRETIDPYVKAGARILCANTAIFGAGEPLENMKQLALLAEAAV